MNAVGAASARHALRCLGPMPGSIITGTAPALNNPKTSAKKSRLGLTKRAARTP